MEKTTESWLVCAKAKLLASEYLLHRNFDLKPSKRLLTQQPTPHGDQPDCFHLTATELAIDAVKLLWRLSAHKSVRESEDVSSCSWSAWGILPTLLKALHFTARLLSQHNFMDKAYNCARDGAMFVKTLHLRDW